MGLSTELISQFVKATKDDKQTSKETTMQGTVVYDGRTYVKLDGSDQLTPVSTTANVVDGERVTVLIKDHTATITGNMSSPAARNDDVEEIGSKITEFEIVVADKVSAKELEVERGRINTLVSDNVTIREELNAAKANIDDLEADNVKINETLTAQEANITKLTTEKLDATAADIKFATIEKLNAIEIDVNNLEATHGDFADLTADKFEAIDVTIKNLDAEYATIERLEVAEADIDRLEADFADIELLKVDVADINTLIFGSATGDVIQTNFANAVIAQLGNAQIKSAMIENISASKITSGDVITNNVRVMSEDGSLIISDETIQIKDDARVRVQIGKDSEGDYSINIWDASGKLMFSEGGITDNAIKNAIIRNDMVSENANISASKLDINSLFEEINGSTKTINSTKIYLDDEKQTLNVAFESLSSDLDETKQDVSSQGTTISVMQGQIDSKVWQQDIDTATGVLSNQYSALEQTVDEVSATVAKHTTDLDSVSDQVSELELSIEGFKTSVSETYVTKDEHSDAVDRIEQAESRIEEKADEILLSVSNEYTTKDKAVGSVHQYYLLADLEDESPEKPTVYPPTGDWRETEPEYTDGKPLYTTICTVYNNGSFSYSDISLSSALDAANSIKSDLEKNYYTKEENNASIITSAEGIVMSALESYVEKTEYDEFKGSTLAELIVQAGAITANFETTTSQINATNEQIEEIDQKYSKNISLSEDGISVADTNNIYEIGVDNVDGVVIKKDGVIRSQLVDDYFYTGNIFVETNKSARFGNFAFIPRSDGSLSFLKVGD